ncbi:MAG: CCA tRNA nucleotidyltransferase [Atribacterota bacterium]
MKLRVRLWQHGKLEKLDNRNKMTRLKQYLNEEKESFERWKKYVSAEPMLKNAVNILTKIEKKGFKAYIVGGCVRDIILGKKPKDVDIATNCPIDVIDDMYKSKDIGKSKDFGIVTVKSGGFDYEIAQFRQDGKYFDGRRPESVKISQSFKEDAERRDFTINAMAIDSNGNIIDHFDGRKDIKNKLIRTVGNPTDRFKEDYLRMLRCVRFSSRLGFKIDPETAKSIKVNKNNIEKIAPERIKDELLKIASNSGDKFADAIITLDELGILEIILPEIVKMKQFQHNTEHHPEGNVFDHTIAALRQNNLTDPLLNFSILLHDIGKLSTYEYDPEKGHTYHGHAEASKDFIDDIAQRLRLSNKEKEALIFVAVNHMKLHKATDIKPSKLVKIVSDENWEILKAATYCDKAARGKMFDKKKWEETLEYINDIKNKWGDSVVNKTIKIVDGNRIMNLTGLKPGKKVGQIIKHVTQFVLDNGITDQKLIDNEIMYAYENI